LPGPDWTAVLLPTGQSWDHRCIPPCLALDSGYFWRPHGRCTSVLNSGLMFARQDISSAT
jgi:hypothetical protein